MWEDEDKCVGEVGDKEEEEEGKKEEEEDKEWKYLMKFKQQLLTMLSMDWQWGKQDLESNPIWANFLCPP